MKLKPAGARTSPHGLTPAHDDHRPSQDLSTLEDCPGEVILIGHEPFYELGLVAALEGAGFTVRWSQTGLDPGRGVRGTALLPLRSGRVTDVLRWCGAQQELRIIILIEGLSPDLIRTVLKARIHGVASRSSTPDQIVQVLRSVREGVVVVTPSVVEWLARRPPVSDNEEVHLALTEEQRLLLRLIASGRRMQDVASQLAYSQRTMYRRQRELFARLGVRSRPEALCKAGRLGLLEDELETPR